MSKKHKYSVRVFQCPECNNKMYAPKGRIHCCLKDILRQYFVHLVNVIVISYRLTSSR